MGCGKKEPTLLDNATALDVLCEPVLPTRCSGGARAGLDIIWSATFPWYPKRAPGELHKERGTGRQGGGSGSGAGVGFARSLRGGSDWYRWNETGLSLIDGYAMLDVLQRRRGGVIGVYASSPGSGDPQASPSSSSRDAHPSQRHGKSCHHDGTEQGAPHIG
ncbi:hypothetical protein C8R44DRAFT_742982 [Mycena epipterygia]|nr:hypothetical protein C8R44DRAFT_742982 [Mycena epipterygia]